MPLRFSVNTLHAKADDPRRGKAKAKRMSAVLVTTQTLVRRSLTAVAAVRSLFD